MLSVTSLICQYLSRRSKQTSSLTLALTVASDTHTITNGNLRFMASHSPGQLLDMMRSVIPPLEFSMHKGQAGRVAVFGGCQEYTGAPYFAAISALKVGADISHVFCSSDAGTVIKSYSPELIVHPILDSPKAVEDVAVWMPRFHSLVIGPGLGRKESTVTTTAEIIKMAKKQEIPLVIDADGLHLVTLDPSIVQGYPLAILTPNVVEFARLYRKVFNKEPDRQDLETATKELSEHLGHVTIVHKGVVDIISDGNHVLVCCEQGSPRRCGGQGDLLSGSMGIFVLWAKQALDTGKHSSGPLQTYGYNLCAAYGACTLTRRCSILAFQDQGRAMTTTDMIQHIHTAFEALFSR